MKPTQFVNINGTPQPVHFGMVAHSMIEKATGITLLTIEQILKESRTIENNLKIAFIGISEGHRREKTECPFNDWVDFADQVEGEPKEFLDVLNVYFEQNAPKEKVEKKGTGRVLKNKGKSAKNLPAESPKKK